MSGAGAATMTCRVCDTEVPAAAFCGTCGAQLSTRRGDGRGRLRISAYAAAPGEHTLRLSVASTLFPHLPHRSRTAFRMGLALLVLALIALALLRWQAPLIAIAALGVPLIICLYFYQADVHRDLPMRSLVLTAVLGIALGIGWALLSGALVADSYDVTLDADGPHGHTLLRGAVIPIGSAVLMLVPVVVIRLLRPVGRESLDGFVFGLLSAISFVGASTLTRLAPQFATGVMADDRPTGVLLAQVGIQGVALPFTAAAVGGLVGVALWFGRRSFTAASLFAALGISIVFGLLEAAPWSAGLLLGLYLLIAAGALLAARVGLQVALLHEAHDPLDPNGHVLCPHCDHVIGDMAFCPNCGVAARAASRTSRTARRAGAPSTAAQLRPGYATPEASYAVAPVRQTSHTWLAMTLGAGAVVAAAAGLTAAALTTPAPPRYVCPPDCGYPPLADPIESNPRFVSADGAFSVQYPGPGTAYEATLNPDGVELDFVGGDTGTMQFFGLPADGRGAKQIADDLIGAHYPDAEVEYEIPNAMVGYVPGYGVVADDYPQDTTGTFTRVRLVVMVAVQNDYALVAAAIGPYHEFSHEFGNGHPSAANLQLALDMGKYVNSFRWQDSD